jgi:hypothetical protein
LYTDIVICIGPLPFLENWPPIYRGHERMVRDRLKASQVHHHVYFRYTPCLTDFTFEFIWRPIPPILSSSYWTFVELTLVSDTRGKAGSLAASQLRPEYNPELLRPLLRLRQKIICKVDFDLLGSNWGGNFIGEILTSTSSSRAPLNCATYLLLK